MTSRPLPHVTPAAPYPRPPASPGVLRLDRNEGPLLPADLLRGLSRAGPELLRCYPGGAALEGVIARQWGIAPERVLVTAGGDDAIDRAIRAFVGPERTLLLPVPTFEMFERNAALSRSTVVAVPWRGDRFPIADVLSSLDRRTGMVAVVSPNNPTGGVATFAELEQIATAAGDALVFFDHAYAEYADEDLTSRALRLPNVVVLRTFSKARGLAGCRVGYVLGEADTIGALRAAGAPFAVSAPSLALAADSLASGEPVAHVTRVRREREEIASVLARHGVRPWGSQGNFVSADFGGGAPFTRRALEALGVVVRDFPDRPGLTSVLRITMPGDESACRRLVTALETALTPEALLLDLDGVLADVEESYRACVLATCVSFGVAVTREELLLAMLEGNANDDWVVTQRLLKARGVEAPLDEIIACYQGHYLGTEATPGLRERERLIVPADVVRGLRRPGLQLGIVTGRPRAEAEWFLERTGVASLVDTVIAMEDGPVKPDPAPVRLAVARLGVERAWMVGDTPDDVRAAAAAGVVPIGIVAPGEDPERVANALTTAGAAVILGTLHDIEALLR